MSRMIHHKQTLSLYFSHTFKNTKINFSQLMDYRLSYYKLPTSKLNSPHSTCSRTFSNNHLTFRRVIRAAVAKNRCCLNTPLEPRSVAGKYLRGVLLNQRESFDFAVADELKRLAVDRDDAVSRMICSLGSDEESLHRRIAQLKRHECEISVEDVMYVMIISKFSDIRVPLVPRLSRCIYNNRLEILPSKDWELESIHGFEFLEMIKEHISAVIGLRADSSINEHWAITKIQWAQLGQVYAASILFGYFLKSASLRLHFERSLAPALQNQHINHRTSLHFPEPLPHGLGNFVSGHINYIRSTSSGQSPIVEEIRREKLRCYVMGFDPETMQRCAKVKSKESVNLIEKHTGGLFGDGRTSLVENNQEILTSFSSLKRLVLEAIAFGIFLWDTEEYVDTVYELVEN